MVISEHEKTLAQWIGARKAHYSRCAFLSLFILPMAVYFLFIQLKTFIVVAIFNYTGFNVRPYLVYDIYTERDTELIQEKYSRGQMSWGKIKYISQRYMTYWIVIILLICATKFVNEVSAVDILNKYEIFKGHEGKTLNYLLQVLASFLIGFANIIPTRAVRPDISAFISAFSGEDYVIRDSSHTRLKDLTEILDDIKELHFALFRTESGSPIIVSTKVPEDLNSLPGFPSLLNTDTFSNNQILRFIQIEEDVDSFFVLHNNIGMCNCIEFNPFKWSDIHSDLRNFKFRVYISDLELNLYGGASLVLLVALFSLTQKVHTSAILTAWVIWPVLFALMFRRKKSKLASINFFTLSEGERKYQPYNNIHIYTDNMIQKHIADFEFFNTLFKISMQGKYLMHIVLKCTESLRYDWLVKGIRVRDFRRLVSMAATLHQTDIALVTPRFRTYASAPKNYQVNEKACVVFNLSVLNQKEKTATVKSVPMMKAQFEKAFGNLPYGVENYEFENLYLK